MRLDTPQARWRARNPKKRRAIGRNWYAAKLAADPGYFKRRLRKKRRLNPERFRKYRQRQDDKVRLEVFTHYCNGRPHCQCPGCTVREIAFLTVQHVLGGGCKQRRRLRHWGTGINFYRWLRKHKYPQGFAVYCANCNMAASRQAGCPHTQRRKQ